MRANVICVAAFGAALFCFLNSSGHVSRADPFTPSSIDDENGTDSEPRTEGIDSVVASDELIDVKHELQQVSNLSMNGSGHDLNYEDVLYGFDVFKWGIPLTVDDTGFRKSGIHLGEIVFSGRLQAGGVSRRSSFRFVLDRAGVGYFVDDNRRLVVTTKPLARVQWLAQSKKPQLEDLGSPSVEVRRETVFAAGFWNIDPELWEQPLVSALEDADRDVRFDAAYALGELGPQASASIDALCGLLKSEDLSLRDVATYAVAKKGSKAIRKLLELIDHKDRAVAIAAVKSLGAAGSAGNEAVPALIEAGIRFSEDKAYRNAEEYCEFCHEIASALALVELGDAVPVLRELLKSDDAVTRSFAIVSITEIGRGGRVCEPELQKLLSDPSTRVRRDAANAFSQIELLSNTSTDALEAATRDSDYVVRLRAASALQKRKSKQNN